MIKNQERERNGTFFFFLLFFIFHVERWTTPSACCKKLQWKNREEVMKLRKILDNLTVQSARIGLIKKLYAPGRWAIHKPVESLILSGKYFYEKTSRNNLERWTLLWRSVRFTRWIQMWLTRHFSILFTQPIVYHVFFHEESFSSNVTTFEWQIAVSAKLNDKWIFFCT